MKIYDLQVHTNASPCSSATPKEIVDAATRTGLDGIAVTDHDTLESVAQVQRLAPPELDVISSVEVTTTQGHLLALGVDRVPPHRDPLPVIDDIHRQGGVAVLSHPFDALRQYFHEDLETIAREVDGVECINSRCVRERYNEKADEFARTFKLARTGGSDSHFPTEVGRAYTACRGSVLTAIRNGETRPHGRGRYLSGHLLTKVHQFRTWWSRSN